MLKTLLIWLGLRKKREPQRYKHITWKHKAEIGEHVLVSEHRIARNIQRWGYENGKKFSYRKFLNQYIVTRKA